MKWRSWAVSRLIPGLISRRETVNDQGYSGEDPRAEEGEGCLSVNREVEGIIPRHARITVGFYDTEGNYIEERVREEISVAFQHEMDHLDGILFTDRIDKKDPYKGIDSMRSI